MTHDKLEETIDALLQRVKQAHDTDDAPQRQLRVAWFGHVRDPAIMYLDEALGHLGDDEAVGLTKDLYEAFRQIAFAVDRKEMIPQVQSKAEQLYGSAVARSAEMISQIGTLTCERREFRIFYAPPFGIGREHVDSAGRGCLLEITAWSPPGYHGLGLPYELWERMEQIADELMYGRLKTESKGGTRVYIGLVGKFSWI